jgi:uncharacterized protein YqjF (DUF2071 family)
MSVFLFAQSQEWINFLYPAPIESLQSLLPVGLVPEIAEGMAWFSLMATEFREAKFKGLKLPFQNHFPGISLRILVRKNNIPGYYFLRQIVAKHCIAQAAQRIYKESYEAFPIEFSAPASSISTENTYTTTLWRKSEQLEIRLQTEQGSYYQPIPGGLEAFLSLRNTGFSQNEKGQLLSYTIEHQNKQWITVNQSSISGNLGSVFKNCLPFEFPAQPALVQVANGREIKLSTPRLL